MKTALIAAGILFDLVSDVMGDYFPDILISLVDFSGKKLPSI